MQVSTAVKVELPVPSLYLRYFNMSDMHAFVQGDRKVRNPIEKIIIRQLLEAKRSDNFKRMWRSKSLMQLWAYQFWAYQLWA